MGKYLRCKMFAENILLWLRIKKILNAMSICLKNKIITTFLTNIQFHNIIDQLFVL